MGILRWLFTNQNDEEEDHGISVGGEFSEEEDTCMESEDSEMSEYERGQAYARAQIDARRRRGPRYQAPDRILGTCSKCGRQGGLQRSERGWLCRKCARRAVA